MDSPRAHVAVLVVVLVMGSTIAAVPGLGGGGPSQQAGGPTENLGMVGVVGALQQDTNTTERQHENPENRSQSGDLRQVRGWLAGRMGEVLVDCTEGATARQFGACDRLDEDYPKWLEQYVDVSRETETDQDDETAAEFDQAQENQRSFANNTRDFWQTYDEYREARREGDTDRARRLGRQLRRYQQGVNRSGDALAGNYRNVSNVTEANTSGARVTINEVQRNVTNTTRDVEEDLFVATTLTVDADTSAVSFLDPMAISGRITTDNGSALADRTVRIAVGNRTYQVDTDEDGRFTVDYRPTTLPLAADQVAVRYLPRNESLYLPANATVPVSVDQVEPTVSVQRQPESVAYNDTLTVTGSVTVEGIDAATVPVRLSLDGTQSTVVRTTEDGTYRADLRVPANVPAGERDVTATVPLANRALAPAEQSTTVTVTETSTSLTLNGSKAGNETIRLAGRLTTADGEPIRDQTVQISVGGDTVTTVQTDPNGSYNDTVTVPQSTRGGVDGTGTVSVVAEYQGPGSNLEPARAETTVRLGPPAEEADGVIAALADLRDLIPSWTRWQWALSMLLTGVVLGALGLAWRRRELVWPYIAPVVTPVRRRIRPMLSPVMTRLLALSRAIGGVLGDEDGAAADAPKPALVPASGPPPAGESGSESESLLDRARQHLDAGESDAAVQTAYAAARARATGLFDATSGATHWEFYLAGRERLAEEQADALRRVTEAYETAAFAPATVGGDIARGALQAAEDLQQGTDMRSDGGQAQAAQNGNESTD